VAINSAFHLSRKKFTVSVKDRLEFSKNFEPDLNLILITTESKFVAAHDDGNIESVPDLPEMFILTSEQSANLILIFEAKGCL